MVDRMFSKGYGQPLAGNYSARATAAAVDDNERTSAASLVDAWWQSTESGRAADAAAAAAAATRSRSVVALEAWQEKTALYGPENTMPEVFTVPNKIQAYSPGQRPPSTFKYALNGLWMGLACKAFTNYVTHQPLRKGAWQYPAYVGLFYAINHKVYELEYDDWSNVQQEYKRAQLSGAR